MVSCFGESLRVVFFLQWMLDFHSYIVDPQTNGKFTGFSSRFFLLHLLLEHDLQVILVES